MKRILVIGLILILVFSCGRVSQKNLTIKSSPTKAQYIILSMGEKIEDGLTPAQLSLQPGTYTIIVKKAGYKDFLAEIELKKGKREVITPKLMPVPGRLVINSFPQQAKIYLDDVFCGRTPRTINNIDAGVHKLALNLSGYREYVDTIVVEPDQTKEINVSLVGGRGEIVLRLDRPAAIYLDGKFVKEGKNYVTEIDAGIHKLLVLKDGYKVVKREIVVHNKKSTALDLKLEKAENIAAVRFDLEPKDADIFIEGVQFKERSLKLPYGNYYIEVRKRHFRPFADYVKIREPQQKVKITLEPLPGNVAVNTVPAAAEVFFNDEMMGITPLILDSVEAGEYDALIKKKGYNSYRWKFVLEPQGSLSFNVILKKHYKYILRKSFIHISASPSNLVAPIYTKLIGDKIYVADQGNARIVVLDISGSVSKVIQHTDIMKKPVAFYVDKFKNIYVVDRETHRVLKFDQEGDFLQYYGGYGNDGGMFSSPTDIARYSDRYIYVVDSKNARVQIFNPNMKFLTAFGLRGRGLAQFMSPLSIAVHPTAGVYVTDIERSAILKFDYLGIFKKEILTEAVPLYIEVDPDGNILVSLNNGKIAKYDLDLQKIETLDIQDVTIYSSGKFDISPDYSIVVPDSKNDKIYIFERQWDEEFYR